MRSDGRFTRANGTGPRWWLDTGLPARMNGGSSIRRRNLNPKDTMWVVRAAVCTDAACSGSIPVYVTHWFATGPHKDAVMQRQSEDTVSFMARDSAPHVLVGDLNVFESASRVCGQAPNWTALRPLRDAGYRDAWRDIHGTREGYTGMVNRSGCGEPEGYPWKRIDYVWLQRLSTGGDGAFRHASAR